MNFKIKRSAQAGFTLIELIVVIVILGILAATALPRFANLGADARLASLNAARGALTATAAMAHGKYLIAPPAGGTITVEGATITFATTVVSGYPKADNGLVTAAGMTTADYTIIAPGTAATANSPLTSATQIAVIPNSVAGTPVGLTCFTMYTEATSTTNAPAVTTPAASTSC